MGEIGIDLNVAMYEVGRDLDVMKDRVGSGL